MSSSGLRESFDINSFQSSVFKPVQFMDMQTAAAISSSLPEPDLSVSSDLF